MTLYTVLKTITHKFIIFIHDRNVTTSCLQKLHATLQRYTTRSKNMGSVGEALGASKEGLTRPSIVGQGSGGGSEGLSPELLESLGCYKDLYLD